MSNKQLDQSVIEKYIDSAEEQQKLYRKTLFVVIMSQIFGGAGLAAGITVGALLAQDMMGSESVSGLPTALFTFGSAGAALMVGRLSQKFGRRSGLTTGFLLGGAGAAGVIISAILNNVPLLFLSLLIYGSGTATNLQARYAGTDLAGSEQRAKAVSMAMVSTTLGAVAGPNLVNVTGSFAEGLGIPALAGPFILAAAAYISAGLILFAALRPDPFLIARAIADRKAEENSGTDQGTIQLYTDKRGIVAGAVVMVITQFVMVAVMTMAPIYMGHFGHSLGAVGLVIGFHIGAMYLPSLVTGYLVDRIGRVTMAMASIITLIFAGIVAAFGPGESIFTISSALILLGLGWNFGLISGTAMLVDASSPKKRAGIQGSVDVSIAFSGALGGGLSGVIVAYSSYGFLSMACGLFTLIIIPVLIWAKSGKDHKSKYNFTEGN